MKILLSHFENFDLRPIQSLDYTFPHLVDDGSEERLALESTQTSCSTKYLY